MAQDSFEIRGELVAHGKAPFNHEVGNNPSYFVTTKSSSGKEHTQWGADLERAVKVGDASVGDKVHIKQDASLNKLDDTGKPLAGSKITYDIDVTEKAPKSFEIRGELVAHGKAPFNHEAGNNPSYFVTTKSSSGKEHTQWGADLERAVKVGDASVGDKVHLSHTGSRSYTIKESVLDKKGNVTGEKETPAKKVFYDLTVTEKATPSASKAKASSEKANPHLDSLKGMSELKTVPKGDLEKLAALRQIAADNAQKPSVALANFDKEVRKPEMREAALSALSQNDNKARTATKESEHSL